MSIRICWIIPTLDEGGAEKQLCLLAKGIDRRRFEPLVVTLTRDGPRRSGLEEHGVPIVSIGKRGKLDPLAWRRLIRVLREWHPDVVHTWLFAANAYGRAAGLLAKVPVIFGGERCVDPWKSMRHAIIDRALARRTTGIITNTSAVVDFYQRRGIPSDRFHVIANGVAPRLASSITREEAAERMKADPNRLWIGSIGRLWPQKGHKEMIWTAEMVRVLHQRSTFLILGDGPERRRLEHYTDQIRAAKEVRFLGHRSDIDDLLPHLDIYWNASRYEGQSNSILEAMAARVPVIASDIPGNRDLVLPEVTGLLYPVADVGALLKQTSRLVESAELRQRLGAAAGDRIVSEFSVASMIRQHEELYEAAVQKAKSRST